MIEIEYIDSISLSGWGILLKAFIPTDGRLLLSDVFFYAILPVVALFVSIFFAREIYKKKNLFSAWRQAGQQWISCGLSCVIIIAVIFAISIRWLGFSVSEMVSFETQYRESLPGYSQVERSDSQNIMNVATKLRNPKRKIPVTGISVNSPEYEVVEFFYNNYCSLHPGIYALFWICFLLYFFIPGFKMSSQRTQL